ncbi:hypothetical protein HK104_004445, partial [Borealophlyctis nickersoniae]
MTSSLAVNDCQFILDHNAFPTHLAHLARFGTIDRWRTVAERTIKLSISAPQISGHSTLQFEGPGDILRIGNIGKNFDHAKLGGSGSVGINGMTKTAVPEDVREVVKRLLLFHAEWRDQFIPKEEVPDGLCVRKFFAYDLDTSRADTPLFESILRYQYPDEDEEDFQGIYNFLLMSIGRMFFKINERDNWQYMPYLEGSPGSGKSNIMNIITKMFDKVGTLSSGPDETFYLGALYNQEVVLIDDLLTNFKDVFPQTDFQSAVSGGLLSVRKMRTDGFPLKWGVPFMFAGNWSPGYLDKGQVTRRILRFLFEHSVKKCDCDPTLERCIVKTELASLIYKCLSLYKEYFEKHNGDDVWDFCPVYFRETQTEMRAERNPLYAFLTSEQRFVYEEDGAETPLHEVKRDFERKFLKKPCSALDR